MVDPLGTEHGQGLGQDGLALGVVEGGELPGGPGGEDPVDARGVQRPVERREAGVVEVAVRGEGHGDGRDEGGTGVGHGCSLSGRVNRSVRLAGDRVAAPADEEVEVDPLVGLQDVVDVEALPPAHRRAVGRRRGLRRGARRASSPAGTSRSSRRPGRPARSCRRPRTSDSGPPAADSGATCSTTVPYAVPLIRPSLIRTMSRTPCASSFGGIGSVGDLRHPRVALRAAPAQHQHAGLVDVEVGVVDAGRAGPRCCRTRRHGRGARAAPATPRPA